jgi:predicted transcriptional regulator
MKILRIGIAPYEEMKARTMAIARGELKPKANEPSLWFTSIESLARVLSDRTGALLDLMIEPGAELRGQACQERNKD